MDIDLVVRASSGDHDAFARLATSIASRFHGTAYAILREPTLAEEAAQSALVNVWRDLPRLRDPSRFEAWSYRILLNACFGVGRQARWRSVELTIDPPRETVAGDDFQVVLDRDQLERGFARLSLRQRAVLVTHYFLDLPSDEAAEALGIPIGTYKSRLHRATESMRALLEADARPTAVDTGAAEVAR